MFLESYRMVSVSSKKKERGLYRWVESERGEKRAKQTVIRK